MERAADVAAHRYNGMATATMGESMRSLLTLVLLVHQLASYLTVPRQ